MKAHQCMGALASGRVKVFSGPDSACPGPRSHTRADKTQNVPIHHWKCDDEAEQHQIHIKMEETGTMILFTNKTYRKYTRYNFFCHFFILPSISKYVYCAI
jgi:hypothetical protein